MRELVRAHNGIKLKICIVPQSVPLTFPTSSVVFIPVGLWKVQLLGCRPENNADRKFREGEGISYQNMTYFPKQASGMLLFAIVEYEAPLVRSTTMLTAMVASQNDMSFYFLIKSCVFPTLVRGALWVEIGPWKRYLCSNFIDKIFAFECWNPRRTFQIIQLMSS